MRKEETRRHTWGSVRFEVCERLHVSRVHIASSSALVLTMFVYDYQLRRALVNVKELRAERIKANEQSIEIKTKTRTPCVMRHSHSTFNTLDCSPPTYPRMSSTKPYWPLLVPLLFRSLSLLLPQTYFQPDEFYQALEPAHWLVFGYGHLTWEWRDLPLPTSSGDTASLWWEMYRDVVVGGRMRGWLWPGVFAGVYKLLQVIGREDWIAVSRVSGAGSAAHYRQLADITHRTNRT